MGYDFEIKYKKGVKNVVVDALSRRMEDDSLLVISNVVCSFVGKISQAQIENEEIQRIIHEL